MSLFNKKDINPYMGLRENVLAIERDDVAYSDFSDNEPIRVLVEYSQSNTYVSVMASADGTASIYLSSGGGFLGGGQRSVRMADTAKRLVFESKVLQSKMVPAKQFPLPKANKVNYYCVTRNTVYYYEGDEEMARTKQCEFFKLYYLAQYIISEYRKMEKDER